MEAEGGLELCLEHLDLALESLGVGVELGLKLSLKLRLELSLGLGLGVGVDGEVGLQMGLGGGPLGGGRVRDMHGGCGRGVVARGVNRQASRVVEGRWVEEEGLDRGQWPGGDVL